mgnify:CR=1 FL=1
MAAGEAGFAFYSASAAMPYVKQGRLRALATTGEKRSSTLSDLPTVAEAALPGFETVAWSGLLAPTGTPKPVIDILSTELKKVVADPAMKERFINIGFDPTPTSSEEMVAVMHKTADDWAPLIKRLNIKLD